MTPKQFFDFGEAGLRSIGFFKKGWIAAGEDGSVTITYNKSINHCHLLSILLGLNP